MLIVRDATAFSNLRRICAVFSQLARDDEDSPRPRGLHSKKGDKMRYIERMLITVAAAAMTSAAVAEDYDDNYASDRAQIEDLLFDTPASERSATHV